MPEEMQEYAPEDPLATLPTPGRSGPARMFRRLTGGPGQPLFDGAVWVRHGVGNSRRRLRRWRQGLFPAPPRSGEGLRTLSGVRTPAVLDGTATPLEVHRRTAAWLRELLDSTGIDYFALQRDSLHIDLGIRASDAEAFRAAVAREWRKQPIVFGQDTGLDFSAEAPRRAPSPGSWASARAVRLIFAVSAPNVDWAWPLDNGVTVQFWKSDKQGVLGAPIRNRYAPYLLRSSQEKPAELTYRGEIFNSFQDLVRPHVEDIEFPVDLVYTWVDGQDPAWREQMRRRRDQVMGRVTDNAIADARFRDLEELRYSLRSVHAYAPWINRIWIVTDGQTPAWLRQPDERVTIVDHRDIWDDTQQLPVFNSHAIESRLHHIPGLAEHYLYFNDDMMFGRLVEASEFFTPGGLMKFFPSPRQIGLGARTLHEGAAQTAAKNDREVLLAATGTMQTQRLKHAGYPQRLSVAVELEELFPEYYRRTASSTFRSTSDISSISLQSWYAYRTGRAVAASIPFRYIDLVTAEDLREMEWLRRQRDAAVMCLNQSENARVDTGVVQDRLHGFLDDYLPIPSPYEVVT